MTGLSVSIESSSSVSACGYIRMKNDGKKIGCNIQILIIGITIFVLTTIPQDIALIKVWGNLTLMADNLIISMPIMIRELTLFVPWLHKKDLARLFIEIERDWIKKNPEMRNIMIKNARIGKQLTVYGLCLGYFSVVLYTNSIFFNITLRTMNNFTDVEGRILPLQAVYPYDISSSSRYFFTFGTQVFSSLLSCTTYTGINVLFGVFVLHACGQLEIISDDIVKMSDSKNYQQLLKRNIQDHIRVIRFINQVEKIFNLLLLALFSSIVISFCLLEFNLISVLSGKTKNISLLSVIFFIQFLLYFIFITFIYSWVGEKLITQSSALHTAACNTNWCTRKSYESLQLIILLLRSQYPLLLTVGKIASVRLTTFAALLKSSVGYASVLRAVQK
uniref:Odorant receptor n=1 Tax=Aulacocentrum confusum TaxID=2767324 RepID=A0A7G8Z954_9HYME|nr:olfactory receptor 35 [Aulacocentrum confusum]